MIYQTYGGAWEDMEKYCITYDTQGLCSIIADSTWSYDIQGWAGNWLCNITYNSDNKIMHSEMMYMIGDVWISTFGTDWTYANDDLIQIMTTSYQNGEDILGYTVDFVYNSVVGRLDNATETFYTLSPSDPAKNKYYYEWDTHGRLAVVQKYYKPANDSTWTLDLRNLYTYLPEDESTYAEHLHNLQNSFSYINPEYSSGYVSFLIDQNPIMFSPDSGVQWYPYFLYNYIYNPDLSLYKKQYYLTINGSYILQNETKYAYQNDLLSMEIYYEPVGENGSMFPISRYVYEYTESVENDDQATPSLINSFSLYPNPCNQQASVNFGITKANNVKIDVYNLKGQKVRSLLNGFSDLGKHKVSWDGKDDQGSNLSSGIYLLQLTSGNDVRSIKAVLVK
jgi:hypothetical protein